MTIEIRLVFESTRIEHAGIRTLSALWSPIEFTMEISSEKKSLAFPAQRHEREELLTLLRTHNERRGVREGARRDHRYSIDECLVLCEIEHPGGSKVVSEMLVSDISASGIGVVTRGYLHKGTRCTFTLTTNTGEDISASSQVVWCRLLLKQFHSAGMMLDERIDPKEIISPKAWLESPTKNTAVQSETLHGKVLHIDSDPMLIKLSEMMLNNTGISIFSAHDTGSALDRIKRESFDAVIIGLAGTYAELSPFINAVAREGYSDKLIFNVGENQQAFIEELASNGFKNILIKPFHEEKLRCALHEALKEIGDPTVGTTPIYSQITCADAHNNWITDYIDEIKQLAKKIDVAISVDDTSLARSACTTMHTTGIGYGFPILSDVAGEAITALNASCSAKESELDLRRLMRIIDRITPA